MEKQSIGEFLALLRRANGFTQQEVADRIGVSNRTLSAWERGTVLPDIMILPVLAELYGVTVDEILSGKRKAEEKSAVTKKSELLLLKNRIARFSTQAYILFGVFFVGLILLFFGWYYDIKKIVYATWEWWILLLFVGLAAAVVAVSIFIAVWRGAEASADDSDENYGIFCTLLRKRVAYCAYAAALLSAALAIIAFFYWNDYGYDIRFYGMSTVLITFAVLAVALFLAGWLLYYRALIKWGGENICSRIKQNGVLFRKMAFRGLIPVGLALIIIVTFTFWQPVDSTLIYENEDRAEFTKYMESIYMKDVLYIYYTYPENDDTIIGGEDMVYFFPLSELAKTAKDYERIDLGNDFICYFNGDKIHCVIECPLFRGDIDLCTTEDGSYSVYNLRFASFVNMSASATQTVTLFGSYNFISTKYCLETRGDGLAFVRKTCYNYSPIAVVVGVMIIIFGWLICAIVYSVKRQKINVKLAR